MKITVPAARVRQGNLSLYTTSLTVRNLMQEGFYSIEHLDPETGQTGYQRLLQTNRAKRLADYIIKGQEEKDAFLPTSVFLATEKNIVFNPDNNTITFDIDEIGGFSVVDGQHRLEGLRLAAEKNRDVYDFELPVNIAYNLSHIDQMCHFLIVNTTQKSVDKGIEQQIISRLTKLNGLEKRLTLPKWIQNIIDRGDVDKALELVKYLNTTEDSPWQGKVRIGTQSKTPKTTINGGSFVKMIENHIMTTSHPLHHIDDLERERGAFLNYWKAIANLLEPDDESQTVLYKHIGALLFSMFSTPFFYKMNAINEGYEVKKMEDILKNCFDNMDGEYEGVGSSDWWLSGSGQAGGLNSGAVAKVSSAMARALNKS